MDDLNTSQTTFFEEDDSDMETLGSTKCSTGSRLSCELMNVSSRNISTDSTVTRYDGSLFDDETRDIDVVDGEDDEGICQLPLNARDRENEASSTTSNNLPLSLHGWNLATETSSEYILRISTWVMTSSPDAGPDNSERLSSDSLQTNLTADYIAKLINLCTEKMDTCPLFLSTAGSVADFEKGCICIFQLVVRLLESNYITEGLMQIINLVWAEVTALDTASSSDEVIMTSKTREVMLMVLNCAAATKVRLDAVGIEKILSHDIFTEEDYFHKVSLCSNIRAPSKEFTIFQHVETWINNALELSLECRTAIVDLDIRVIQGVVVEANRESSLFLSLDEQSKYAAKAQRVVREILFNRMHTLLGSQGFKFEVTSLFTEAEMSFTRNNNDRTVPNAPPIQNRTYVDAWLRNEIADAIFAISNDERESFNRSQLSPFRGSSSDGEQAFLPGGSSQGSGRLNEGTVNFEGVELGRSSQDSRDNQGYSSSLSQVSLPRMVSLSQSSTRSNPMFRLENQYILQNQFVPSSPDSSQEPPWKRACYNNSQSQ